VEKVLNWGLLYEKVQSISYVKIGEILALYWFGFLIILDMNRYIYEPVLVVELVPR
jgi:hypothetical protein